MDSMNQKYQACFFLFHHSSYLTQKSNFTVLNFSEVADYIRDGNIS